MTELNWTELTECLFGGLTGGLVVKNPPAMQETRVQSLDGEDPLEEKMATHSSILAWKVPWPKTLVGHSPKGHKRVRHDLATKQQQHACFTSFFSCFRNRNLLSSQPFLVPCLWGGFVLVPFSPLGMPSSVILFSNWFLLYTAHIPSWSHPWSPIFK